jgi:hypothetical protein
LKTAKEPVSSHRLHTQIKPEMGPRPRARQERRAGRNMGWKADRQTCSAPDPPPSQSPPPLQSPRRRCQKRQ